MQSLYIINKTYSIRVESDHFCQFRAWEWVVYTFYISFSFYIICLNNQSRVSSQCLECVHTTAVPSSNRRLFICLLLHGRVRLQRIGGLWLSPPQGIWEREEEGKVNICSGVFNALFVVSNLYLALTNIIINMYFYEMILWKLFNINI